MDVGRVGPHFYLVGIEFPECAGKRLRREKQATSWLDQVSNGAHRAVPSRMQCTAQQWSDYIEELRTYINTGTYSVDSITLAGCILVNETHFVHMLRE